MQNEYGQMATDLLYPGLADVLSIHEDIIAEDPDAEPGVRSPEAVEAALTYISVGYFDQAPDTIHAKAAHLLRLLIAEHPFVDGNKRAALNTVAVFYDLNGYDFVYEDESIRDILNQFATDAEAVKMSEVIVYCREHTQPAED